MPSKQVLDRQKSTRDVVAAAETHAADVAKRVRDQLAPFLKKGEAVPDVGLLLRLIGRRLASTYRALELADAAHEKELGDDDEPRTARDAAAAEVRSLLVDVRASIATTYGDAILKKLALADAIPSDPSALQTRATAVAEALSDHAVKWPKPRRAGVKVDRESFAEQIAAHAKSLKRALSAVARETREAQTTQAAKWASMAAHDDAFERSAHVMARAYALAGLDDLASRLRPSRKRPGQTASEGGDAPEPVAPTPEAEPA